MSSLKLGQLRKTAAQELVDGYPIYQKYINSSIINYATVLKHAGGAEIEFDYQSVLERHSNKKPLEEITIGYQKLVDLRQSFLSNHNEQIAVEISTKAEELIAISQEYKLNLARLSTQIQRQENIKWELESQRKATLYYAQDFNNYLDEIYKEGSKSVLSNWEQLRNSLGIKNALAKIEKNHELLGSLLGVGWNTKLSISDKRAIAVFNLQSLSIRLKAYEKSIEEGNRLKSELHEHELLKLNPLKEAYKQLSSSDYLSQKQEHYLYEIIEHKDDLVSWLKVNAQQNIKEANEDELNSQGSQTKIAENNMAHKIFQNTFVESQISKSKGGLENTVSQDEETSAKVNKYEQQNQKYSSASKISYGEMHDKLCDNAIELSKQLLPLISKKRIEITKHAIKCGSINISLDAQSRGLWYRFSRIDEKGDLFDLIKVAQGLSNKQAAIEWGKSYLGIEDMDLTSKKSNLSFKRQEQVEVQVDFNNDNKKNTYEKIDPSNLTILTPVPSDAVSFNPKKLFYYQLNTKKQILEDVYAYKNINNELCGYVVRIKDQETDKKATLPVVYTENDKGIRSWRSKGFGDNRSLYNEQRLHNSNKPVLIVEGEKTADSAQSLYPEFDVISWSGGASSYIKSNWDVLKDKQVTIWPDNDQVGIDAAHNIKSLLESKNITKAQIVDLKQIDFLPQKWDLADELPEDMRQHQITGLLCIAEGISDNVRIEKTLKVYMDHRQDYIKEELKTSRLDSLSSYILEKETIKYRLHYEESIAKETLKNKPVISSTDELFIGVDAVKLARTNIKSLSSSADMDLKTTLQHIEHDLAQIYKTIPKTMLIEVAKISMLHTQQLIDQHNSSRNNQHSNKIIESYEDNKQFNLSKADLPILALAFAS